MGFIIHLKESDDPSVYLERAAEVVMEGSIIAYPTDTVYGMGADPLNIDATQRVFALKERDATRGVPILVPDIEDAKRLGKFSSFEDKIAREFWPGPLTIVVPLLNDPDLSVNKLITGGNENIALRIPSNPIIFGICKKLKELSGFGGIIGTSANYSGEPSIASGKQLVENFSEVIDFIIEMGTCSKNPPSTVIQLGSATGQFEDSVQILREGEITKDQILAVLTSSK